MSNLKIIGLFITICLLLSTWLSLGYAPTEVIMGDVQRIFYFHVGSALATYIATGAVLIGGLGYISTRKNSYDHLALAGSEVGFLFASIVMLTGMIWGHSAWNTWFRWEPRLVSFLVLWLIFLSQLVLRRFGEKERVRSHSAVLGIMGAIMVPVVMYSIRLLPQFAQLHPQLESKEGLDPDMRIALLITSITVCALAGFLLVLRTKIERIFENIEERN